MDDLRKLAEAATPGPWRYDDSGDLFSIDEDGDPAHLGHVPYDEDGEFIAACSPAAILALLDRAERAERERDEAESKLAAVTAEALTDNERMKIAACMRACDSIFKDYAPAEIDGLTASVRAAWRAGQMANEGDE